jgi:putative PIN family toxin of toxin-antitoxin system
MKVVLDCNVLVSAAISRSTCRQLFDEVARFHTFFYSREMLQEFLAVMKYTHLRPYYPRAKQIIKMVLRLGVEVRPAAVSIELPDPDDAVYLQTALAAKAEVLVTGNRKHFPFDDYQGIKILTPRELLSLLQQKSGEV